MKLKNVYNKVLVEKESAHQKFLDKHGIVPEKADPSHSVCSIGYSEKEKKWYGWSHRAVNGFKVGDKVKEGDCAYVPSNKEEFLNDLKRWYGKEYDYIVKDNGIKIKYNGKGVGVNEYRKYPKKWGKGEWTAKTLEDAKQMAMDFAESVS